MPHQFPCAELAAQVTESRDASDEGAMAVIVRCSQRVGNGDRSDDDVFDQRMIVDPAVDDADQGRALTDVLDLRQVRQREVDMPGLGQVGLGRQIDFGDLLDGQERARNAAITAQADERQIGANMTVEFLGTTRLGIADDIVDLALAQCPRPQVPKFDVEDIILVGLEVVDSTRPASRARIPIRSRGVTSAMVSTLAMKDAKAGFCRPGCTP